MNRNEIIEKFYGRIDSGFLNIKPKGIPLQSVDNSQESIGKLFMALTSMEKEKNSALIDNLLGGIRQNITINYGKCFLPRVKVIAFNEPVEDKKNLWERLAPRTWIRTDVSVSQLTYLLMGLSTINNTKLLARATVYIKDNDFIIKRHDGKPSDNGNFNIFYNPIVSLRKYFIKELLGMKHGLAEKVWHKVFQYLTWGNIKKDNGLNMCLIYYSIGNLNKRTKKRIIKFIDSWMENFQNTELKDELHWVLLNKIRKEL